MLLSEIGFLSLFFLLQVVQIMLKVIIFYVTNKFMNGSFYSLLYSKAIYKLSVEWLSLVKAKSITLKRSVWFLTSSEFHSIHLKPSEMISPVIIIICLFVVFFFKYSRTEQVGNRTRKLPNYKVMLHKTIHNDEF